MRKQRDFCADRLFYCVDALAFSLNSIMERLVLLLLYWLIALCFFTQSCYGQIQSLPVINIAQGKKIEATSTCGVDVSEAELFCKLATPPGKFELLGLSCDYCDPIAPSKHHPIEYAIDGSERWWQSPPLSRGLQYQQVNITIDLGQVRRCVLRDWLFCFSYSEVSYLKWVRFCTSRSLIKCLGFFFRQCTYELKVCRSCLTNLL